MVSYQEDFLKTPIDDKIKFILIVFMDFYNIVPYRAI